MINSKKILAVLMAFGLCTVMTGCGSSAGNAGGNSAQTETSADSSNNEGVSEAESETKEDKAEDAAADQTNDTDKTANVGIIAWSTGLGDEYEFTQAVQTVLSEQYPEQIGEVIVMDAGMDTEALSEILENIFVLWEGKNAVILIVNDENGFSDEELLNVMKDAEKAGKITGVDHVIEGAPESTFVYDASDAAGCAAKIMENVQK